MIIIKIQAGLGNQLFQYATARALSIRFNKELKVDLSFYSDPKNKNAYRLDQFNLPISEARVSELESIKNKKNIPLFIRGFKQLGLELPPYYKTTHYTDINVHKLLKVIDYHRYSYYLEGWFFIPVFFHQYRDIIMKDLCSNFQFPESNRIIENEIKNTNSVAIHIRRGDFLTNTYFKLLPKSYYLKAISQLVKEVENPTFYFFSNDPAWTRKEFANVPNANFIEINSVADTEYSTKGDINDLMLMRLCKHQIIANSSFSWWGAWLNNNINKRVMYPAIYFNNAKAQKAYEKNTFMPTDWIKINL